MTQKWSGVAVTKPINSLVERHWRISDITLGIKAEENNHLCRLSFPKMSSEFECSVRDAFKGLWFFRSSFSKSGLLETSQPGLTQTEANVSNPCWQFWPNGCIQDTAQQYHSIPPIFLGKYLFYLTTVVSKQKMVLVGICNKTLAVRWLWMEARRGPVLPGIPAAVLHPGASQVGGCWPASPRVHPSGALPGWGALCRFSFRQCCPGTVLHWWMVTSNCESGPAGAGVTWLPVGSEAPWTAAWLSARGRRANDLPFGLSTLHRLKNACHRLK